MFFQQWCLTKNNWNHFDFWGQRKEVVLRSMQSNFTLDLCKFWEEGHQFCYQNIRNFEEECKRFGSRDLHRHSANIYTLTFEVVTPVEMTPLNVSFHHRKWKIPKIFFSIWGTLLSEIEQKSKGFFISDVGWDFLSFYNEFLQRLSLLNWPLHSAASTASKTIFFFLILDVQLKFFQK